MKRLPVVAAIVLLVVPFAFADFPIRQGPVRDWLPAVAYNPDDHEYLVVWSEGLTYVGGTWINGVMGQRIGEDGAKLGSPFVVFQYGVNATVAYNAIAHEYLVGFNPGSGFAGQRISRSGSLIGTPTSLMDGVSVGRLVYNSITGQYLFVGAVLVETPTGSGYYNIQISSCKIGSNGQALSSPLLVANRAHGYQPPEPAFGAAYAPVQSTETPYGRYLLAIGRGVVLYMLNSDGAVINVVSDPSHPGVYYQEVPFKTHTPSGGEFHVDVAYGDQSSYSMTGPAFLVVWADQNNKWNGQSWNGIWGGFLDATKISYLTTDITQDNAFPISGQADHFSSTDYVESWKPKATYNPASEKFFVAWRETPNTNPLNTTTVNHIRGNYVFEKVPATNVIISATSGTEDPARPALAASTTSEHALIIWQDSRNIGSADLDIYGNMQKVADPVEPPVTDVVVVNTLDGGPGSLRQAMLNANAHPGKDTITFNIPASGPHTIMPTTPLPALSEPLVIDGFTQPGSRANTNALKDPSTAIMMIVIDGSTAGNWTDGIWLKGGNSCVRGLVISSFLDAAIRIDSLGGNVIQGNYLGTDSWGLIRHDNAEGVWIDGVADNLIGGATPEARNLISGNSLLGVAINSSGATRNVVQGNYIGVNANGTDALGNIGGGIGINKYARSNTIGGTTPGAGNVISGCNTSPAIARCIDLTGPDNEVVGNFIGTNAAGDKPVANRQTGIFIWGSRNTIGGTSPGARNIISGNALCGIQVYGDSNTVLANYIGTDVTGTKALPNDDGIQIGEGQWNQIGGVLPGSANLISGNHVSGVTIQNSSHNLVVGNYIGTQANGTSALGNNYGVVVLDHGYHNTIGGVAEGAGNIIAFNGYDGVAINSQSNANRISGNSIFSNGKLGINLWGGVEDDKGVTNNDPGDGDTGANNLQNFPLIGTIIGGSFPEFHGILSSTPNSTFTIEFFSSPAVNPPLYGEGRKFLGWITATTDATGIASFDPSIGTPVGAGESITATATDSDGNTSEFGIPVTVTLVEGTEVVTNTLDVGPGSLRQAILNANAKLARDTIAFNIPGVGLHTITPVTPLPALTDPVVIDGYTQPGSSANTKAFAAGTNAVLTVEIDGYNTGEEATALRIQGGGSVVRGIVINHFTKYGISIENRGGTRVEGCFIGSDPSGMVARGNSMGIYIDSVGYNTIGGTTAAGRNLISANHVFGVCIEKIGARGNVVQGNYIGVNATGSGVLGNEICGVSVWQAASNTVGGTAPGAGNVISGCGDSQTGRYGYGVIIEERVATGNSVAGNLIGTNASGTEAIPNNQRGVFISTQAMGNTVGGTPAGARNIISGNMLEGIEISGDSNFVRGNYIGTDISGSKPLGNAAGGICVDGSKNVIGGTSGSAGNLISGNGQVGILFYGGGNKVFNTGNKVLANRIGIQSDGASPLGNSGPGILLRGWAWEDVIGDTLAGAGNIIAYNSGNGILLAQNTSPGYLGIHPQKIRISSNSIYANDRLGIDLVGDSEDSWGTTPNDPGDTDNGPNGLQNFPVLLSAEGGGALTLRGSLNSTPNAKFRSEFFGTPATGAPNPGEGQTYLGSADVTTDAGGNVPFNVTLSVPVAAGRAITSTATDEVGNTSEFCAPIAVATTGLALQGEIPHETALMQNYPNPFNPSTTIGYTVAGAGHEAPGTGWVRLVVYDMLGREVAVLVNEKMAPGKYQVAFDGAQLSSGVYICRLTAGGFVDSKRMMFLK